LLRKARKRDKKIGENNRGGKTNKNGEKKDTFFVMSPENNDYCKNNDYRVFLLPFFTKRLKNAIKQSVGKNQIKIKIKIK
jgi:hypothetical protein